MAIDVPAVAAAAVTVATMDEFAADDLPEPDAGAAAAAAAAAAAPAPPFPAALVGGLLASDTAAGCGLVGRLAEAAEAAGLPCFAAPDAAAAAAPLVAAELAAAGSRLSTAEAAAATAPAAGRLFAAAEEGAVGGGACFAAGADEAVGADAGMEEPPRDPADAGGSPASGRGGAAGPGPAAWARRGVGGPALLSESSSICRQQNTSSAPAGREGRR